MTVMPDGITVIGLSVIAVTDICKACVKKSSCVVPSDSCALASKTHDYKLMAEALSGGNNAVSRIIGHACFKTCSIGVIVITVRP